jgi:Flp pilus assembly protein TadG
MSKETSVMNPLRTDRQAERGQILVLFTIAIVVVIGMLGLVLDGGSAFAQRRDQQNVSDLAALAGANAYLVSTGDKTGDAIAAARAVALKNGYATDGATGQVVDVVVNPGSGGSAAVTVTVTKPHANNFSSIMGMSTWGVSAHGTAQAALRPNGVQGAMPLLFNQKAFPNAICNTQKIDNCASKIEVYQLPGNGNEDLPRDATQFNWTIFCTANGNPCNANSDGVDELIHQGGENQVVFLDEAIGPLNAGNHTTLFTDMQDWVGSTFPVPIVCTMPGPGEEPTDPPCKADGAMVGWAYFHLISSEGNNDKVIKGYFTADYFGEELVLSPNHGDATLNTGAYLLRLTD